MPMLYSVYQGKGGSLPFRRTSKKPARTSVKYALVRAPKSNLHYFKRSASVSLDFYSSSLNKGFYISTNYSNGIAITYSLGSFKVINNVGGSVSGSFAHGDIQSMYDQYKITGATLRFYSSANASEVNDQLTKCNPLYTIVNDFVDATVPTSEDELRSYSGARDFQMNGGRYTVKCRPRLINEVMGSTGTAVAAGQSANQWLQTSNATVPMYGTKLWANNLGHIGGSTSTPEFTLVIVCELTYVCKNVV